MADYIEPGPHLLHCDTSGGPQVVSMITCAHYLGGNWCFVIPPPKETWSHFPGGRIGEEFAICGPEILSGWELVVLTLPALKGQVIDLSGCGQSVSELGPQMCGVPLSGRVQV